jgi:hypothetical protein
MGQKFLQITEGAAFSKTEEGRHFDDSGFVLRRVERGFTKQYNERDN